MARRTKRLAIAVMLTGIAGLLGVAGWSGSSLHSAPAPAAAPTTSAAEPAQDLVAMPFTQPQPEVPRVSVSFNDDARQDYALLKGTSSKGKTSRRADVEVWYGQYSEQDYRVLPASPVEKEPSRLNVKLSIAF